MRDIRFRGKRLDNGEWVVGDFEHDDIDLKRTYITPLGSLMEYEVNPETAGQYTGLKDKIGKEIYEGDVVVRRGVTIWEDYINGKGEKWSRSTNDTKDEKGIVVYNEGKAIFETGNPAIWLGYYDDIEVIGNIYENPELLEVSK